jgi:hypothetical protein
LQGGDTVLPKLFRNKVASRFVDLRIEKEIGHRVKWQDRVLMRISPRTSAIFVDVLVLKSKNSMLESAAFEHGVVRLRQEKDAASAERQ